MIITNTKKGNFYVEVVFILVLLIFLVTYYNTQIDSKMNSQVFELESSHYNSHLQQLCSQLILNTGTPVNWNSSNVTLIGLRLENSTFLSQSKIYNLTQISNQTLHNLNLEFIKIKIINLSNNQIISQTNQASNDFTIDSSKHKYSTFCFSITQNSEEIKIELEGRT